ncbi:MAG: conjugative transfer system coupling protein TraD [Pseudomonadota bacterium]
MMPAGVLRATELVGVAGWSCAALVMAWLPLVAQAATPPAMPFVALAFGMAAMNALSICWRWRMRSAFASGRHWTVPVDTAIARTLQAPASQWLGRGFDWTPLHAQRMQRVLQAGSGMPRSRLVDAVEPRPRPLYMPADALSSHTLVFGQTGTGKTRLAELLVTSFLARHPDGVVLVIDPKGDRDLHALLARACRCTGRGDALVSVHPAFPGESVRFDPLRNFNRASSIASRITSLLPSPGQGDAFVQFAWRAIHSIVEAMVYVGMRPTLASIRRCLEGDARPLLAQVLQAWEARTGQPACGVSVDAQPELAHAAGRHPGRTRARADVALDPRLGAAVARYRAQVVACPDRHEAAVEGLLSWVTHDPVHRSKMIQNVLPLLTALTSGALGPLLSPDASDGNDRRPVFDARKVIDQRRCLYLGLDALVDPVVAGAIGAIVLADLAQVAGELFNDRSGLPRVPVLVFVDEAAEVVNAPLVQLLNKSRGAGFSICLAAQTVHDYEAKLGSAAAARMLLGNPGNLIALRTADLETQRFCAGSLSPVPIETIAHSRSTGIGPAFDARAGGSTIGTRRDLRDVPLFAPEWLGLLPDLHFVARIAGGRTVKGELPRLVAPGVVDKDGFGDGLRDGAPGAGTRASAP